MLDDRPDRPSRRSLRCRPGLRYRPGRTRHAVPPLEPPRLSYLVREGLWRVDAAYAVEVGGLRISVPAGWRFDLASVPRFLWWLIAPFELSLAAPLVHDFLYRRAGMPPRSAVEPYRTFDRAEADRLFCLLMARQGVAGWRLVAAYVAVRLGGFLAWRRGDRRLRRIQRLEATAAPNPAARGNPAAPAAVSRFRRG